MKILTLAAAFLIWVSPLSFARADGGHKELAGYDEVERVLWEISFKNNAQYPVGGLNIADPDTEEGGGHIYRDVILSPENPGASTRKGDVMYTVTRGIGEEFNTFFIEWIYAFRDRQVQLDRADSARALLLNGKSFYAVFYDQDLGTSGLYQINTTTGVTTLIVDFSQLDVEPLHGSLTRLKGFYYLLAKPLSDMNRRVLLKFNLSQNSVTAVDVVNSSGQPVPCDKLNVNVASKQFVCLSSPTENRVEVCGLTTGGAASCVKALRGVTNVERGPAMSTSDGKSFWVIAHTRGEVEHESHAVRFDMKGKILKKQSLPRFLLANFRNDANPLK